MEDKDSVSSKQCIFCGQDIPSLRCDVPECPEPTPEVTTEVTQEVTMEVAAEAGACQTCGALESPCGEPDCPQALTHQATLHQCQVCGREVSEHETCDRPDCPRVAAEQIRKASIDTPFKLGL